MPSGYLVSAGALVVGALLAACPARAPVLTPGSSGVDLRGVPLAVKSDDGAADTWNRYHQFLASVLDGALYDQWQLNKVVSFFETASGIQSGLIGNYFGRVLDYETLRRDLQGWETWYATNGPAFNMATVAEGLPYPEQP